MDIVQSKLTCLSSLDHFDLGALALSEPILELFELQKRRLPTRPPPVIGGVAGRGFI